MRFLISFALLNTCLASQSSAATIRVPADIPTIQIAINAAGENDTVLVAPGTYFENLTIINKNIILKSEAGSATTIIDGNQLETVIRISGSGVTRKMVVDGFTIQRGRGFGGGISVANAAPTIINNVIQNNNALGDGSGIRTGFATPLIQSNIIRNNSSTSVSGGGGGGGIYVGGNACGDLCTEIRGNLIEGNSIPGLTSGGGIALFASGPVDVIGNVIRGNQASSQGGGISMANSSDATIENNIFEANTAGSRGGAIYWLVPSGNRGPWLTGNTVINNVAPTGAAIYADGYDDVSRLANNLVVNQANTSSVIHCGDLNSTTPPIIRNNMIQTNTGTIFGGVCQTALGTEGNFAGSPTFELGSFRLALGSQGVDRGLNDFVTQRTDTDRRARIVDGDRNGSNVVDVGAYELQDFLIDGFE